MAIQRISPTILWSHLQMSTMKATDNLHKGKYLSYVHKTPKQEVNA